MAHDGQRVAMTAAGGATTGAGGATTAAANGDTITVANFAFSPPVLTVKAGAAVDIKNTQDVNHTFPPTTAASTSS